MTLSNALSEVDAVLQRVGVASSQGCQPISAELSLPFSAPAVVSGAAFGTKQVWRVTFRSTPTFNSTGMAESPNNPSVRSADVFSYWPSETSNWYAIEPVPRARCVFDGCVQPGASSNLGVWLVVDTGGGMNQN